MKQPKSFEDGISRLEEILEKLKDEETPLAQSVKLYAEAAELIQFCNQNLQQHQQMIEEIDLRLAGLETEKE